MTVGVTIGVPDPWGAVIDRARRAVGDPLGGVVPAHITLIPPTIIDALDLGHIESHLTKVAAATAAFTIRLSGTSSFRPVSDVVFLKVAAGAEACDALAHAIRLGPIRVQQRYPYHPHVTIAQNLEHGLLDRAERDLADFEAEFEVTAILLSSHGTPDVPEGTTAPWTPRLELPLA